MKILWVAPKWPLPVQDGARLASKALFGPLSETQSVDLLSIAGHDEQCDIAEFRSLYSNFSGGVEIVRRGPRAGRLQRIVGLLVGITMRRRVPITYAPYAAPSVKRRVERLLQGGSYDIVILDGLHPIAAIPRSFFNKVQGTPKLVYRAHNVETEIWQRAAGLANAIKRRLLIWQAAKVRRIETFALQNSAMVAAISREDISSFSEYVSNANYKYVPIGLSFSEPSPVPRSNPLSLLYVGKLDWPPNRDGLQWFLREVWPEVTNTDLVLRIIGSGECDWLEEFSNYSNIECLGRVARLEPYYLSSIASVVPVFYGSGTRLKVVEPATFGRCCIVTRMAIQGSTLGPDEVILADTKSEWLEQIDRISLDDLESRGYKAFHKLKDSMEERQVSAAFVKELQQINHP